MIIYNFYDYIKNPIVQFCLQDHKDLTIYTLEDVKGIIEELNHSKEALSGKMPPSFIGDQLRLYMATKEDNFFYLDADVYMPKECEKEILKHKNCTAFEEEDCWINNGTFFKSDKDCRFNKYYLDLYQKLSETDFNIANINIFKKYPFELNIENRKSGDMDLLTLPIHHFYLSSFRFFKDRNPEVRNDTIYYSLKDKFDKEWPPIVWMFKGIRKHMYKQLRNHHIIYFFDTDYPLIDDDTFIRLFKEQMNYTYQKDLKFVEV